MADVFRPRRAPAPSPVEFQPKTLNQQFGDGYQASANVGINSDLRSIALSWKNLRKADADYIIDFIAARKGTQHFMWRPNGENVTKRYKCGRMTYTWKSGNFCDITAEFQQMGM